MEKQRSFLLAELSRSPGGWNWKRSHLLHSRAQSTYAAKYPSHCGSSALLSRNHLTLSLSRRQTRTCTHLLSHINYAAKTPLHFIEIWASHSGADSERCAYNSLSEGASVCWVSWKPSPLQKKKKLHGLTCEQTSLFFKAVHYVLPVSCGVIFSEWFSLGFQ